MQPADVALAQVVPPGAAVAAYPVIALPPSLAGAVQVTATCPSPAVSATPVGAPGTPVQKLPEVVEVDEVQLPSRARAETRSPTTRSSVGSACPAHEQPNGGDRHAVAPHASRLLADQGGDEPRRPERPERRHREDRA